MVCGIVPLDIALVFGRRHTEMIPFHTSPPSTNTQRSGRGAFFSTKYVADPNISVAPAPEETFYKCSKQYNRRLAIVLDSPNSAFGVISRETVYLFSRRTSVLLYNDSHAISSLDITGESPTFPKVSVSDCTIQVLSPN